MGQLYFFIFTLIMVREKHYLFYLKSENTSILYMKSQKKVFLKKLMNPVLYKTLILNKVSQKWK